MKIKNSQKDNKKRLLYIAATLLLLIAFTATTFALLNNSEDMATTTTSEDKTTERKRNNRQSNENAVNDDIIDYHDSGAVEDEKTTLEAFEGQNPESYDSLSGAITHTSVSVNALIIRTNIDQVISNGTCTLTLTKGEEVKEYKSEIHANPSSSTCKGFDIPTSELSSGKWTINIRIESLDKSGTLTGDVEI